MSTKSAADDRAAAERAYARMREIQAECDARRGGRPARRLTWEEAAVEDRRAEAIRRGISMDDLDRIWPPGGAGPETSAALIEAFRLAAAAKDQTRHAPRGPIETALLSDYDAAHARAARAYAERARAAAEYLVDAAEARLETWAVAEDAKDHAAAAAAAADVAAVPMFLRGELDLPEVPTAADMYSAASAEWLAARAALPYGMQVSIAEDVPIPALPARLATVIECADVHSRMPAAAGGGGQEPDLLAAARSAARVQARSALARALVDRPTGMAAAAAAHAARAVDAAEYLRAAALARAVIAPPAKSIVTRRMAEAADMAELNSGIALEAAGAAAAAAGPDMLGPLRARARAHALLVAAALPPDVRAAIVARRPMPRSPISRAGFVRRAADIAADLYGAALGAALPVSGRPVAGGGRRRPRRLSRARRRRKVNRHVRGRRFWRPLYRGRQDRISVTLDGCLSSGRPPGGHLPG